MVYNLPLQIQTIEAICNSKLHLWHPLVYILVDREDTQAESYTDGAR